MFFGNQPWTLAIGQLSDQRSWLGITVSSDLLALNLKFRIALGLQIVDGGPKGFGVATSFTGGANWGIGKIQVYGSLGFLWGPWKTGADTSAVHLWVQFGIKMSVFYVFSVGLEVDVDLTYLTRPGYWLYSAQIHIDTPWFLPDVSFSISGHSQNSSQPMDSPLLNPPLNSGDAGSGGAGSAAVAMHVPALSDGNTDPNAAVLAQRAQPAHGSQHRRGGVARRPGRGSRRRRYCDHVHQLVGQRRGDRHPVLSGDH